MVLKEKITKIRVLGALETPPPPPPPTGPLPIWQNFIKFANFAETWFLYYVKYKTKTIFFCEVFPFSS